MKRPMPDDLARAQELVSWLTEHDALLVAGAFAAVTDFIKEWSKARLAEGTITVAEMQKVLLQAVWEQREQAGAQAALDRLKKEAEELGFCNAYAEVNADIESGKFEGDEKSVHAARYIERKLIEARLPLITALTECLKELDRLKVA